MTDARRAELEAMHLTRLGRPDDVAYAVVYLASRESEFVTGGVIPVDGGGTIARGRVLG
jgi:NAD(P)-dependent dehydrogenase (short-subunit alcohol dehydrogenase family)